MSFAPPRGAELVHVLGAGTVTEVAVVRWRGNECICKRLRSRMVSEPIAVASLAREAAVLEMAAHPALPELLDHGRDVAGPYVLETCLRGASLRELVDGWRERGARLPTNLVHHIIRESVATFAELHGLGGAPSLELVHGDVAPDHLLLGEDGKILVVDWGQARWRGMPESLDAADRGTLPFVAPEIAREEQRPSQPTDVYALAATLAFVALGREPCAEEPGPARLVEIAERGVELEALSQEGILEPHVRVALVSALRFDPADRIASAAELLARLAPDR